MLVWLKDPALAWGLTRAAVDGSPVYRGRLPARHLPWRGRHSPMGARPCLTNEHAKRPLPVRARRHAGGDLRGLALEPAHHGAVGPAAIEGARGIDDEHAQTRVLAHLTRSHLAPGIVGRAPVVPGAEEVEVER